MGVYIQITLAIKRIKPLPQSCNAMKQKMHTSLLYLVHLHKSQGWNHIDGEVDRYVFEQIKKCKLSVKSEKKNTFGHNVYANRVNGLNCILREQIQWLSIRFKMKSSLQH